MQTEAWCCVKRCKDTENMAGRNAGRHVAGMVWEVKEKADGERESC